MTQSAIVSKQPTSLLRNWVQRHPTAAYLSLVLGGSWATWSLLFFIMEPGGMVHNPPVAAFVFAFVGQVWATGCGLLVTWLAYGRAGMGALGARLRNGRVGAWWLAVLIIPLVSLVTPLLRQAAGYPQNSATMAGLLIPGLIFRNSFRVCRRIWLARFPAAAFAQALFTTSSFPAGGRGLGGAVARLCRLFRAGG